MKGLDHSDPPEQPAVATGAPSSNNAFAPGFGSGDAEPSLVEEPAVDPVNATIAVATAEHRGPLTTDGTDIILKRALSPSTLTKLREHKPAVITRLLEMQMPKKLNSGGGTWYRVSPAKAFLDAEIIEFERNGRRVLIEYSVVYPVIRIGKIIIPYDGETLPSPEVAKSNYQQPRRNLRPAGHQTLSAMSGQ